MKRIINYDALLIDEVLIIVPQDTGNHSAKSPEQFQRRTQCILKIAFQGAQALHLSRCQALLQYQKRSVAKITDHIKWETDTEVTRKIQLSLPTKDHLSLSWRGNIFQRLKCN